MKRILLLILNGLHRRACIRNHHQSPDSMRYKLRIMLLNRKRKEGVKRVSVILTDLTIPVKKSEKRKRRAMKSVVVGDISVKKK